MTDARHAIEEARDLIGQAAEVLEAALSTGVQSPIEAPLNGPAEDPAARHRRLHRPGIPSKIEADPDLRAFILARIESMTFAEILAACAAEFPQARRPSMSGLHRWWHNHGKPASASTSKS